MLCFVVWLDGRDCYRKLFKSKNDVAITNGSMTELMSALVEGCGVVQQNRIASPACWRTYIFFTYFNIFSLNNNTYIMVSPLLISIGSV